MIFLTQPDNIETSGSEVPDSINTKASPAQPDKIETSAAASLVEALAKSEGSTISEKNKRVYINNMRGITCTRPAHVHI